MNRVDDDKSTRTAYIRADSTTYPSDKVNANAISTTKYSLITWLPKSLWEQFRRIANVYFLLISILMIIGDFPCSTLIA